MWKMFKDNNDINEKAVIGFMAFIVMVGFAITDVIVSYTGKQLIVNEFIFDAFKILTIACFGIASVDKWIVRNSKDTTDNQSEPPPSE